MVYTTIPCDMRGLARSDDRETRRAAQLVVTVPVSSVRSSLVTLIAVVTSIVGA